MLDWIAVGASAVLSSYPNRLVGAALLLQNSRVACVLDQGLYTSGSLPTPRQAAHGLITGKSLSHLLDPDWAFESCTSVRLLNSHGRSKLPCMPFAHKFYQEEEEEVEIPDKAAGLL